MKSFILFLALVSLTLSGFTQTLIDEEKVPLTIKDAYKRKFAKQKPAEIRWFMIKKNEIYNVKHKIAGLEEEITFDKLGEITYMKQTLDPEKLPKNILEDISSNHKKKEISEAFLITESKKDKYYAIILLEEVKGKDEPVKYEIQYSTQGKFITIYEPEIADNDQTKSNDEEVEKDKKTQKLEEEAETLAESADGEKVAPKDLPTAIQEYMKKNFSYEYRYKVCKIVEEEKYGECYYIIMKKQGEKKQFIHYFDTKGNLLENWEE